MKKESIHKFNIVNKFKCLGKSCPDNCCSAGFKIFVEEETKAKWKNHSPELLNLVEKENNILKCNKEGDCIKLKNGICTIHRDLGEEFLSHTCKTYPRNIVSVNGNFYMSLLLSCPEAARLVLFEDDNYVTQRSEEFIKQRNDEYNYFGGNSATEIELYKIYKDFVQSKKFSIDEKIARMLYSAKTISKIEVHKVIDASNFLLKKVDMSFFQAETAKLQEICNLLIVFAKGVKFNSRAQELVDNLKRKLKIEINFNNSTMRYSEISQILFQKQLFEYEKNKDYIDGLLTRVLEANLIFNFLPIKGRSKYLYDEFLIVSIKLMLIKLFMICEIENIEGIEESKIIQIVQIVEKNIYHRENYDYILELSYNAGWALPNKFLKIINVLSSQTSNDLLPTT